MSRLEDQRFGDLLIATTPTLQRRALSLTRNAADAADLVQDTLLKAWRARDSYQAGTQLQSWLMTILRNTFLSGLRGGVKVVACGLGGVAQDRPAPAAQEWAVAAREVRAALNDLPPEQAEAIVLVGGLGCSHGEVAARLGCVQGTIKSRVSRGREALRRRCHADELFAGGAMAS